MGSGDIVVLCSACMYAFSNVLQEKLLKQEALGILGVFRTLISVLQAWSLGWTRFVEVTWTPIALSVLGLLTRFFGMYELVNLFFSVADAANLSRAAYCGTSWRSLSSHIAYRKGSFLMHDRHLRPDSDG